MGAWELVWLIVRGTYYSASVERALTLGSVCDLGQVPPLSVVTLGESISYSEPQCSRLYNELIG